MTICQTNIYHLIALYNVDSNHTIGTWTGICLQTGLLHGTILGSEDYIMVVDELCIIQSLQAEECIHLVIALDVEEVLDGTTLGIAVALQESRNTSTSSSGQFLVKNSMVWCMVAG